MERLCGDLLSSIMKRVSDDRDRKSCSEACKMWYTTEALTRVRIRVRYPERIPNLWQRFTSLTTLEIGINVSDETLVLVSRSFPKLQILNLRFSLRVYDPPVVDFGDQGLTAVAERCCDLREVSLSRRENVRDGGIAPFRDNARNLTALDLSYCELVTDASLEAAAGMGSLSRLSIRGCAQMTDRGLDLLSNGLASKDLNLCICGKTEELTDAAGVAVASISALQKLDLSWQNYITDNTLIAMAAGMGLLSELYIRQCRLITDHGLDLLSSGPAARNLRVLDISFCEQITDVGICSLKRLSSLEELKCVYDDGPKLTDVAGFAVASISSLRKLDLSMQNHMTNATLFAIANNCRSLVKIGFAQLSRSCNRATFPSILFAIGEYMHTSMGKLDQFSSLYLVKLAEQCPSLRILKVAYGIKKHFSSSQLETLRGMCKLVWV